MGTRRIVTVSMLTTLVVALVGTMALVGYAQGKSRTFTETGKTVTNPFLDYWTANGELSQQGFPISNIVWENSDTDGKHYSFQYFERAVFEYHPENKEPFNVLLSLLGSFRYKQKYPDGAPGQKPNTSAGSMLFNETGKRVGGRFLEYWKANGGLAQQGLPISDEFQEKSDLDGKTYAVQYFERAVFEMHTENKAPFDVLLSQLGTFRYKVKYPNGEPGGAPQTLPTATAAQGAAQPALLATGSLDRQDQLHFAKGTASLIRQADGKILLQLDIEDMASGPDLYVYLSDQTAPKDKSRLEKGVSINLGKLKATRGRTTYELPADADVTKIKTASIYCKQFNVVFSNAVLQPK